MRRLTLIIPIAASWVAIVRLLELTDRRIASALGGNVSSHARKESAHALASLKKAA
jgi:hypothetical protein